MVPNAPCKLCTRNLRNWYVQHYSRDWDFFRFYLISRVRHPDWPSRDLNDDHVMNYHVIISGYRSITFRTGAPKAFLYIHRSKIRHFQHLYCIYYYPRYACDQKSIKVAGTSFKKMLKLNWNGILVETYILCNKLLYYILL